MIKVLVMIALMVAAAYTFMERKRIVLYYRLIKARQQKKLNDETQAINTEIDSMKGDSDGSN